MEVSLLAVIAFSIMAFGMISGRIEKTPLTPPMIFAVMGLLLSPAALGWFHLELESEFFQLLAELTLVLVLFTDASRIDLGLLRREHDLPVRLLMLGMPLTILLGGLAAWFIFDQFSFWQMALLAAILTPTDAALGQAVVSNKIVPVRIRQALNAESGLNDGIALPVVVMMASCLGASGHSESTGYWIAFTLKQVMLGPMTGVLVGYLGGRLVMWGQRSGWMNHSFQDLSAIGLSLAAYALAELAGGNGFIAAFSAGLTLGNTARQVCTCLYEFAEAEGQLLTLLVFLIFGALMVPAAVEQADASTVLYALASLTVVRLVPVWLSLTGTGLRWDTRLFLGWFGPRGIASILFSLLVLDQAGLIAQPLSPIVTMTVLFSILAHGLTAYPAALWYARRTEQATEATEHTPVSEMPVRIRHGAH